MIVLASEAVPSEGKMYSSARRRLALSHPLQHGGGVFWLQRPGGYTTGWQEC